MPVTRSGVQSASSQDGFIQFRDHPDQTAQPSEHVESVSDSQYIEKRVADVCGEAEPLGFELYPSKGLSGNKQQSEKQSDIQPACGILLWANFACQGAAHKGRNPAARYFEREAAGNDNERVQVKHWRYSDVHQRRSSLTNNQGAGEGGKTHGDGRQAYPDSSARGGRGRILNAAQVAIGGNGIAPASVARALARQAVYLDFRRFVDCGCHTATLLR